MVAHGTRESIRIFTIALCNEKRSLTSRYFSNSDDAGFITFLGKFGMALMYIGFAIVILGAVRLLWSKRTFLKTQSQRQLGPIALPFHVGADGLPFARPGTPGAGSRPGSPIGSRSGTPNGDRSRQNSGNGRQGALYYLPVWFMPPGDGNARAQGPISPSQAHGWSQYLPNLSFVEEDAEHRYHPVPNFSRPPSPSNNSILHAPGAVHDGAFDGTPLHSIHSPKPIVPPSSSASARDAFSPPPPTSPNPPAYSSLKSWGSALFRSPRAALLPLVNPGGSSQLGSPPAEDHRDRDGFFVPGHHKSASSTSAATFSSSLAGGAAPPRARSPLPQYQPSHSPSPSQSVPAHGGRGSMVRSSSQQSAGASAAPTGSSHPASEDESGVEEGGAADEVEGGLGSGDEYAGSGVGVEEEVDRLLSEMEPDFEAKLARERRGE